MVKVTRTNILIPVGRSSHKKCSVQYENSNIYWKTPRSRSQCKNKWYPRKGLVTSNTHVKYQSTCTKCSKVIGKVKVFKEWFKLQGQVDWVENMLPKESTYEISSTHCSKVISKVKVSERGTEWQTEQKQYAPRFSISGT